MSFFICGDPERFSHEALFVDLANAEFTAAESAEYLDVSIETFTAMRNAENAIPARWSSASRFLQQKI